MLKNTCGK